MAMKPEDLLLSNGERAPHHCVYRDMSECEAYAKRYRHQRLARAIERFTALAALGGTPIVRRPTR